MKFEQAIEFSRKAEQKCNEVEYRFIYNRMMQLWEVGNGKCGAVEIGSFFGGGSTIMAAACEELGWHLTCIDCWATGNLAGDKDSFEEPKSKEYTENLSLLSGWINQIKRSGLYRSELVTMVVCDSKEFVGRWIPSERIMFTWIDAGHFLEQAEEDIRGASEWMCIGGEIYIHDCDRPTVNQAIRNTIYVDSRYQPIVRAKYGFRVVGFVRVQ